MRQWDAAIADYNSALKLEPQMASSLYGRGLIQLQRGNVSDGNADIAAAIAIEPNIKNEFARYGVK